MGPLSHRIVLAFFTDPTFWMLAALLARPHHDRPHFELIVASGRLALDRSAV